MTIFNFMWGVQLPCTELIIGGDLKFKRKTNENKPLMNYNGLTNKHGSSWDFFSFLHLPCRGRFENTVMIFMLRPARDRLSDPRK